MELAVEKVFSTELLHELAKRFGVTVEEKPLGDFENYVFQAATTEGEKRVLRLTHSSHRTAEQIQEEMNFLDFVGQKGAGVARPFRSLHDVFVESFQTENGVFYASLFEYAPGTHVKPTDSVWNDELFRTWGKTIGQLHRLTMDYPVTPNRSDWTSEEKLIQEYLPDEGNLKAIAIEVMTEIKKLPRERGSFGLIHSDVHAGNFYVDNGRITVFDFDDLTYHYFIHDIAMVLYYSVFQGHWNEESKTAFSRNQLARLREGYETEHVLEEVWYDAIHLFMRLRDILLYAVLLKKFVGKDMPQNFQALHHSIGKRIQEGRPIVEL
jgi:amicoumacin kinase